MASSSAEIHKFFPKIEYRKKGKYNKRLGKGKLRDEFVIRMRSRNTCPSSLFPAVIIFVASHKIFHIRNEASERRTRIARRVL